MTSAKKERKAAMASMTYCGIILAVLGMGMTGYAIVAPSWLYFSPITTVGWSMRYMGLLKLGSQYASPMTNPADLTWGIVKTNVCNLAYARMGAAGTGASAMSSVAMQAAAGIHCPAVCVAHLYSRCVVYKIWQIVFLVIAALMGGGGLLSLVAYVFTFLGKERKKDVIANFWMILAGGIMAAIAPAAFYGVTYYGLNRFGQSVSFLLKQYEFFLGSLSQSKIWS